jgi:hypothetical protein
MLKASFFVVLPVGIYAAFIFGSFGHEKAAPTAAAPLDSTTNLDRAGATKNTFVVNSAAKADRLPIVAVAAESTKVAIEPIKLPAQASGNTATATAPVTSWHWNASSNKITRK